ncbi:MAG: thioesterase family protein [Betaproteobacteria bacterium]
MKPSVPFPPAANPTDAVFSETYVVRFSHCDPAAMVFFPQYFVLLQGLVEDWFGRALGIDYAQLIGQRRIGLPTVSLQCEFIAPSRMGDRISFELRVQRVGKKSITLDVSCSGADGTRLRLRQVLVTTSFSDDRAISIPPDIVQAIANWNKHTGVPT